MGAGDIDTRVGGGHRCCMDLPFGAVGLQPFFDPVPDSTGTTGSGGQQVVVLAQVGGHTVVHDHAVFRHHGTVADLTDIEFGPFIGVEQVEQFGHIGAAQVDFAQRADIDDANLFPDPAHLSFWIAIVFWTNPSTGHHRGGAVGLVPRLD